MYTSICRYLRVLPVLHRPEVVDVGVNTVGVTIVAKNDYCDSIDIAGSTIAILLLLWTTIAILL